MAGTKAHYAGEDRGYGKPSGGKPSPNTGAGREAGGKLINGTKPGGGRVVNGAKIPRGNAYPTQDAQVDAYQGGKVIGGKHGAAVKGNR